MNNFLKIAIIILLFVILTSPFLLKLKNIDEKFALTQISFEYPKNFNDVKKLFTDYFYTNVKLTVSNYSDVKIKVNQAKLHIYTLKNNLFLEQFEPLQEIEISPNSQTVLNVKYQVYYTNLIKLIEDNELKTNGLQTFANLLKYGSLNTDVILKGWVNILGVTININEQITI